MKVISNISEQDKDYSDALRKMRNFTELLGLVHDYRAIAEDALKAVEAGRAEPDVFWHEFNEGHAKEMRGEYAGDEWSEKFGMIAMPEIMFRVSMIAVEYGVPWGLAFTRLKDVGILTKGPGQRAWHINPQPTTADS